MAKKNKKKNKTHICNEIISLLFISIGIFILVSLQTQSSGELGKFIRFNLKGLFSTPVYILPYMIILFGILSLIGKLSFFDKKFSIAITLIYIEIVILYTLFTYPSMPQNIFTFRNLKLAYDQGVEGIGGGLIGSILGSLSIKLFGINGSYTITITVLIISFMVLTKISVADAMMKFGKMISHVFFSAREFASEFLKTFYEKGKEIKVLQENKGNTKEKLKNDYSTKIDQNEKLDEKIKILDFTRDIRVGDKDDGLMKRQKGNTDLQGAMFSPTNESNMEDIPLQIKQSGKPSSNYKIPDLNLLQENTTQSSKNDKKEILHKAKILEETLTNFGVDAKVLQVSKGPAITRYEIQPSPGVKVSKIVGLSDDLALNLAASNIRIEAPIPGKAAVGIEVPNDMITTVTIREVIESNAFIESQSKLSFALGKDIAGNPVIANLAKMPHMLIAGATGSGKSVCINTFITSILYKATPEEVKLLLIDPKVVELSHYNGIPHLLIPVVTDPQKASGALNWAVQEMTDRYKNFAKSSVRDINSYNEKMAKEGKEQFPKIIIIIDELADLMMVSPGQVEDSICRLAQMARAAGIHLIVATQRPSVDVITGVIKANIPSRIAFAVSSQADSRTILDMGGAEKLLGKGDMLFYPVGEAKPIRIQGAFISDQEIQNVVDAIKQQNIEITYEKDIIDTVENNKIQEVDATDELLKDAIAFVVQAEQASISSLQRRFRIGYNRAARLIDDMTERNIVSGYDGSRPRKVLISKEEFEEMKN